MQIITSAVLPVFYFILLAFLLQRNKFFRSNGLPAWFIVLFFAAKCFAGILYSYIALKYIPNRGDIWPFYEDGLELYRTFTNSPPAFIDKLKEMFTIDDAAVLNTQSDIVRTAFEGIKFIHFLLNIFSFGNLYTNTILFNGLSVLVFLHCWVFLKNHYDSWVPGAWLFLFPSAFFYTAGIHKEGIQFIFITLLVPLCVKLLTRSNIKKLSAFLVLMLLFFFFKFFVATLFTASLFLWWAMFKNQKNRPAVLIGFLCIAFTGFFLSSSLSPSISLPQFIVKRQQEFLAMDAASAINVHILEPGFLSFLKALPAALANVFFRPLPGEGGKALYMAYSFEIYLFWALVIFMMIKSRFKIIADKIPSMVWALFIFGVFNLLVIGYTIPNIGATMRYRSIFLPFVGLLLCWLFNGIQYFKIPSRKDTGQRLL